MLHDGCRTESCRRRDTPRLTTLHSCSTRLQERPPFLRLRLMRAIVTRSLAMWSAVLLMPTDRVSAQPSLTSAPVPAGLSWSASVRVRTESWRWFELESDIYIMELLRK